MRSSFRSIEAAAALLLLCAVPAQAAGPRHPPVDQCAADRGFATFRAGLIKAIAAKDWPAFSAMLADDVIVDFGGGVGKQAFAEAWNQGAPTSRLWAEARAALSHGCSRFGKTYEAPGVSRQSAGNTRFNFEKRGSRWRITAFVAGD